MVAPARYMPSMGWKTLEYVEDIFRPSAWSQAACTVEYSVWRANGKRYSSGIMQTDGRGWKSAYYDCFLQG